MICWQNEQDEPAAQSSSREGIYPTFEPVFVPFDIYALLLLLLQMLSGSVEADPVPRHRWHPTRPRSPWGSLGKNTGVGCHL